MKSLLIGATIMIALVACTQKVENKIDLSGTWQFAADPSDKGISEGWFSKTLPIVFLCPAR
jgi:hypothetical protein